jgi:hypothetical protein
MPSAPCTHSLVVECYLVTVRVGVRFSVGAPSPLSEVEITLGFDPNITGANPVEGAMLP